MSGYTACLPSRVAINLYGTHNLGVLKLGAVELNVIICRQPFRPRTLVFGPF